MACSFSRTKTSQQRALAGPSSLEKPSQEAYNHRLCHRSWIFLLESRVLVYSLYIKNACLVLI